MNTPTRTSFGALYCTQFNEAKFLVKTFANGEGL